MKRLSPSAALAVALAAAAAPAFAGAVASDSAFSGALSAGLAAIRTGRAAAVATPAANTAPPPGVREVRLASNNSNAPDIYLELVARGAEPVCHDERIVVNGDFETFPDCTATGRLPLVHVFINDIFWRRSYKAETVGDTTCRKRWLSISLGRRETAELWYFCRFDEAVGTGK